MKWSMLASWEGCECVGEMRPFHLSFLALSSNTHTLAQATSLSRTELEWERDLRASG